MGTDNIARGLALQGAPHPGYVSGNYYALYPYGAVAGGIALAANTIRLTQFTITKPLRLSELAARLVTVSAGGNFQLAVYANNAGRPTGAALCSTASLSTASAGPISGAASATLAPGTYWFGINQDNAVATYQSVGNGVVVSGYLAGSTTLANVTSAVGSVSLTLTVAQTYGTWPDLTSASFTESTTNLAAPCGFAKAA